VNATVNATVKKWYETVSDWDANRKLIAACALTFFILLLWASVAQTEEVTRGMGKVIPSSKAQLVQPAEASVIEEILVRSGQSVKKGQLLVRLDDDIADSELSRLQTENARLTARSERLEGEATGTELGCEEGSTCLEEQRLQEVRLATARSQQLSLASAVEQRRRDLSEAQATVSTLENSARLAQEQVSMLEPLAAQGIVPRTELITAQRDLIDTHGRLDRHVQRARGRLLRVHRLRSVRPKPILPLRAANSASRLSTNSLKSTPALR